MVTFAIVLTSVADVQWFLLANEGAGRVFLLPSDIIGRSRVSIPDGFTAIFL